MPSTVGPSRSPRPYVFEVSALARLDLRVMTGSDAVFEQGVTALLPAWRAWLRIKHRRLEPHHADLLQEAAAALLSWGKINGVRTSAEDIRRVGFRILQRRVADAYREEVQRWAEEPLAAEQADPDASSDPPTALAHKQLLRTLVAFLTTLSAEDRELLIGKETGEYEKEPGAMSSAERQRLVRLRRRVSELLQAAPSIRSHQGRSTLKEDS